MAGYLDRYGEGEEQREKLIKIVVFSLVGLLIVGGVVYFLFKNYRQERQVKNFFTLLASKDYQQAYALWGCTESKPCRDYPFSEFMKDWGPQSGRNAAGYHIAKSRSCGSGVIITVDLPNNREEKLWVERDNLTIGFSPW